MDNKLYNHSSTSPSFRCVKRQEKSWNLQAFNSITFYNMFYLSWEKEIVPSSHPVGISKNCFFVLRNVEKKIFRELFCYECLCKNWSI